MRKTLDQNTKTVHIVSKDNKTNKIGLLKCECGYDTGMFWLNTEEQINCLLCYAILKGKEYA